MAGKGRSVPAPGTPPPVPGAGGARARGAGGARARGAALEHSGSDCQGFGSMHLDAGDRMQWVLPAAIRLSET